MEQKETEKKERIKPIIEINDLRVIYDQGKLNEVRSLEDASLKVYPQEYVIIHGPSGCGKSTLLYSIAGLQEPTYGEVTVRDRKMSQMSKKEKVNLHRLEIGMVFQAFYLISSLTILDNVCLPKIFMGEQAKKRESEGMKFLQRFGISEQAHKRPNQLSGGQKQRVAMARALVNNPGIILADEPVGNLDSESAENVLKILKELNEIDKKTIVLVTHNPDHLHFADRIIRMKDGKIVGEEVNKEKRPKEIVEKETVESFENVPRELRVLMRTFNSLSAQQSGSLLIPFKAKQLLNHVLTNLTEEQRSSAENFLKELLFNDVGISSFEDKLDASFGEGGANWNKQKARYISQRIDSILKQSEKVEKNQESANVGLSEYLMEMFEVDFEEKIRLRFQSFLNLRIKNQIDRRGLAERLDAPIDLGGIGLHISTAEKMTREIEIIMLLKYSR